MSSAISTDSTRTRSETPADDAIGRSAGGMQAWHFFSLAALGCMAAAAVLAREHGAVSIVLLCVLVATAALVGAAAFRTLGPLVSTSVDRTVMIGQRTRAALEREKMLALRSIKELEFDRAMGKLSDADFNEMSGRLRARAGRLIRQLDAGGGYREQIERDLATRLAATAAAAQPRGSCAGCGTRNDADAAFCKKCGARL